MACASWWTPGLSRVPRFSARTGMTRLETVRVSRASADPARRPGGAAGAGRRAIACGASRSRRDLVPFHDPEIMDADLAPLALTLASTGMDAASLRWLDAPPAGASLTGTAAAGRTRRRWMTRGASRAHGQELAALGLHPRLGHMIVCARALDADVARGRHRGPGGGAGHPARRGWPRRPRPAHPPRPAGAAGHPAVRHGCARRPRLGGADPHARAGAAAAARCARRAVEQQSTPGCSWHSPIRIESRSAVPAPRASCCGTGAVPCSRCRMRWPTPSSSWRRTSMTGARRAGSSSRHR